MQLVTFFLVAAMPLHACVAQVQQQHESGETVRELVRVWRVLVDIELFLDAFCLVGPFPMK
jgi:hypothetical protein